MSDGTARALLAAGRATRVLLLVALPLAAALVALYIYARGGHAVQTENAYVKADIIAVGPEVSGRVIEVAVRDDQPVAQGDMLFRIDATPFEISQARARAQMDVVRTEVQSLRADYRATVLERDEARERIAFLARQVERLVDLRERGMVRADVFDEAQHNAQVARMRLASVEERINRVLAALNGDPNLAPERHPRYAEARAAYDEATVEISRTVVRAPAAGVVSNMKLQPGENVQRGVPVFSIIAGGPVWIEANFKETQLTHMREGQRAAIVADAYPDRAFQGEVQTIAPATGAEFALLPPQNATGNWVKVVQRIPVRIRVEQRPGDAVLRAGMTVTVTVETGRSRGLPRPLQRLVAAGWLPQFLQPDPVLAQDAR
jgi:membrane fusion protein (multidrug efflux system)